MLAGLLRRERAVGAAVAGVTGAALIARQDELHAERLATLTVATDEQSGGAGDLRSALTRKQEYVFACVDALPRLADPDLRALVMQIAASEAEHMAALRLGGGEEPVPDAFAGYTEAAAR